MGDKLFDQFTYLHFATGIIAYFFGIKFYVWFILHFIFELVENSKFGMNIINKYMKMWPGGKPKPDNIKNIIGDHIGTSLGWFTAYLLDNLGAKYGWYDSHIKS